jgi:hypothetical protein
MHAIRELFVLRGLPATSVTVCKRVQQQQGRLTSTAARRRLREPGAPPRPDFEAQAAVSMPRWRVEAPGASRALRNA